jgi:hypothetical protein
VILDYRNAAQTIRRSVSSSNIAGTQSEANATGGTANDPVDFTLSDTEPVLSDAPVIVLKDKAKPFQSSGSDIIEFINGKRVRTSKEVRDEGEASTSQLAPDIPAAKRSRQDSPASIVPVASTSVPPVKKKSTARKSTQHISSGQSLH